MLPASASTGRMSRASAYGTLSKLQAAAREFISSPSDNSPQALTARSVLHAAESERDHLDASSTNLPNASAIRSWRSRVAALQAARFLHSETELPRISRAICVTAYGTQADDVASAAAYAESLLSGPVRLQDSSHVRTATLTGTRYIFTSHQP